MKKDKKTKRLLKKEYFWFDFVKITGGIPLVISLRPKLYYSGKQAKKKIKGKALVVANHSGYIDILRLFTVLWYRRVYSVATRDLFNTKKKKWFFSRVLCIPVDTDKPDFKFFNECCKRLNEGHVVAIFPEGHLNRTEELMQPFHSGVLLAAMRSKSSIVPMYLQKPARWYHRNRIAIGEPVTVEELCGEKFPDMDGLDRGAARLKEIIEELSRLIPKKEKHGKKRDNRTA